ncbi:MAG TPA: hypothetical protein ENH40_04350 [Nitrospirae bacterium]|nr:hypothetical protein [Nitrospirota bacterium]
MNETLVIKGSRIRPFLFMLPFSVLLYLIFVFLFGPPGSQGMIIILFAPAIIAGLKAFLFEDLYTVTLSDQKITGPSSGISTRTISLDTLHSKWSFVRTTWNKLSGDYYIRSKTGDTIVLNALIFNKDQRKKIFDLIDLKHGQ